MLYQLSYTPVWRLYSEPLLSRHALSLHLHLHFVFAPEPDFPAIAAL